MRQLGARALVVAAGLAIGLCLITGYVRSAAIDSDQFANRAAAALDDDSVRSLIAARVTDDLVLSKEQDLIAARPIIEAAVSGIVGSATFQRLFRAGVGDVHRAVFDRDQDTVTLTVADIGTVVAAAVEKLRPSVAKDLRSTEDVALVRRDLGSAGGRAARAADDVRVLSLLLLAAAILLVAGALALAADRRRTVVELGVGVASVGVLIVVAYGVLRSIALGRVDGAENRAAAAAVWNAFLLDLRNLAWILAGSGAVLAAAASARLEPVDFREPLGRAAAWIGHEPSRPWLRVLRALGFVAGGLVVLIERDAVLSLALALGGVALIYAGVAAILRMIYRPPAVDAPRRPSHVLRRLAVPAVALALVAGSAAAFLGTGGATTAAPAAAATWCNGRAELCARPLDEVALAATHNSMSVPLPGWFSAEQDKPIAGQLADGIRGLLLDTHYADRLADGKLRTFFGSPEELRRQAEQDGVAPDAVDSARRIRERLGFKGEGKRGMYLCHSFCELGGTLLSSALEDIHTFLASHPDDVLVVINQDYVTPADFVAAVRAAGLGDLVLTPPPAGRWPTLREMIDSNRRLVFMAENHAGAAPWYQLAYRRLTQETPYTFKKVAELDDPAKVPTSCRANRGTASAPLFLVNHWISTDPVPLPSNAAKVNAYEPLLRRVRECRRLRGRLPNLVAVNFYLQGDLFRVVDALNGVG